MLPLPDRHQALLDLLTKITEGNGEPEDLDTIEELCHHIKQSALCGLGQTAPNPVLSTLTHFREEFEAHIYEKRCPAGVCKALIQYIVDPTKCKAAPAAPRAAPPAHLRRGARPPYHQPVQVHQVRRVHGSLPL